LHVVLGAYAANLLPSDPVWLMLVGASSGGKTEMLNALARHPHAHLSATLTEASLLSATPRKDRADDAKGGLLREIGDFGVLLLKDFTSVLAMNRDQRAALLAALREIFDGSWTRRVGVDGGRVLHWEGKLGLIAGCTAAVDSFHAVMSVMGERFVFYRLPRIDAGQQGIRALVNAGKERQLRTELAEAVSGLFAGIEIPAELPALTANETARLVALASLAAHGRSGVERDPHTREIELIADSEAPARLAQALRRLSVGLLTIGVPPDEAERLIVKTAFDCMPKVRRAAFDVIVKSSGEGATTASVATVAGYPTTSIRRALEDLNAHGVVERRSAVAMGTRADHWLLSAWAQELYGEATRA
jgi:hypothetical protein